jgi:multidrug efflux pump subunit AcrA (membrane-fusion protein)
MKNRSSLGPIAALITGLVLSTSGSLGGCTRHRSTGEDGEPARLVVDVTAVPIGRGDLDEAIVVEGRTDALRRDRIVSPIAGTVIRIDAIEGAAVREGDTLAVIRSRESQAAIEGAERLLQAAGTETQRNEARAGYDLAVSSQNAAAMRATCNGVVAARSVNRGENVAEGAELFTIIDLASLYFAADVPLRDLPKIRFGEPCVVAFPALPGVEVPATVGTVEPAADPLSQSVRARIVFDRPAPPASALLKADMFGTARIVTGVHRGVLTVPRSAVLRNDETNETSVVVVSPDSLAMRVPVSVGLAGQVLVEIAGPGLAQGRLVIIEGNYGLADSTRVRTRVVDHP